MKSTTTAKKRLLPVLLTLVLILSILPGGGYPAQAESENCTHTCGDGSCAYSEGVDCAYTHEHDFVCGYDDGECNDSHSHDGDCGYAETASCNHACDDACGGLVPDESNNSPTTSTEPQEAASEPDDADKLVLSFTAPVQALTVPFGTCQ